MRTTQIPFNKPYLTGREAGFIADAHSRGKLSGDGHYTKLCSEWIESTFGTKKALLTHSCTGALEMAAILSGIQKGDEVILPSYTFVSTANAFVLRGATPVFVDIKLEDQNIDETLIEDAISPRTKAIVAVHYAGVACEMDTIMEIAKRHNLLVIEDAAQAIFSSYKGRQLGTIGDMGCFSFHETKNVISGEGGAILVNNASYIERAEIIREKGTDRSRFFRGHIDKYTWQDLGSSYLPSEITAAFLWAQLQSGSEITERRKNVWNAYNTSFSEISKSSSIRIAGQFDSFNGHMFQLIFESASDRRDLMDKLLVDGISSVTHYVPLHSSPAGKRFGKMQQNELPNTDKIADGLLRLPLFPDLDIVQDQVIESVLRHVR
jgi:dTDP-4-amino-4,6-dideoxygalactose transaminase